MTIKNVGIIGQRGMVGSVLRRRMTEENDYSLINPVFFSAGQKGQKLSLPEINGDFILQDALDPNVLKEMDIIISTQGSSWTQKMLPSLRNLGWNGFFIDAASELRMNEDSVIVLDPLNYKNIEEGIQKGVKNFIGGNCTVSLLLLAIGGLFEKDWVEWISTMTYQAASGAGARNMLELVKQMNYFGKSLVDLPMNEKELTSEDILRLDQKLIQLSKEDNFPKDNFGYPLAGSVLPWIDTLVPETMQSREEWKAAVEANKILGRQGEKFIPIDGTCVRVGAMRCHSQGVTLKLKKNIPLDEIQAAITSHNDWVQLIQNEKDTTLQKLTPLSYSGTLNIGVGRLRKMNLGPEFLNFFTVGDQLLWGAAEPLRRTLRMLI